MMKFLMVFVLSFFTTIVVMGQSVDRVVEGTQFPGQLAVRNFAINPGCEKNVNNITASGGSLTRTTTTPVEGAGSCLVDATTTGQTYTWALTVFEQAQKNAMCYARFVYTGDAQLYEAQIRRNGATVATQTLLDASSTARVGEVIFTCGDLTQATTLRFEATSNSAAAVKFDSVYVGPAPPFVVQTTKGDLVGIGTSGVPTRIAVGSSGQMLKVSGGVPTWAAAPAGGINYISPNQDAEVDTTGWATYADAAATTPVDGTAGTSTLTLTRTTSTPLRGAGSYLITKDAANRQGNGASYDFTIDVSDKGKVLQGTFDYAIASGTYADDDLQIFIYDVTNAALIYVSPQKIKNHTLAAERFFFEFQTSSSSVAYRLIIHAASTSASAYTVKFDNVNVGPQAKQYGSVATDWVAYTPTTAGFGTVSNMTAYWRRVGDSMEIRTTFTLGTVAAAAAKVSLPSGTTWNLTSASNELVGYLTIGTGTSASGYTVIAVAGDAANFGFGRLNASDSGLNPQNGSAIFPGASVISFFAKVPIVGWSSSQLLSNDADTRVVTARAYQSGTLAVTSGNPIAYNTVQDDTHGGMGVPAAGRYTVQSAGYYRVHGSSWYSTGGQSIEVYKNGVSYSQGVAGTTAGMAVVTSTVKCIAGDILDVRTGSSITLSSSTSGNFLEITKVQGPAQIAASESISASYSNTAGPTIAGEAIVNFANKNSDSHSSVTTGASWKFTAQQAGKYLVTSKISFVTGTYTVGYYYSLSIFKNGSVYAVSYGADTGASAYPSITISEIVSLVPGDYIDLRARKDSNAALNTSANYNTVNIVRVGNY